MNTIVRAVLCVLFLSAQCLFAQGIILDGGGDPPPPPPPPPPAMTVNCPSFSFATNSSNQPPWGFYVWQVDQNPLTTTLTSEMDFSTTPAGLVVIFVPPTGGFPCVPSITVHEVHGTVTLEAQNGTSCQTNSIVTEVRDQNGNALAAAYLMQLGPSTTNVSVKGTFSIPLTVTSLQLIFNVNPGCQSVVSWSLIMS